MNPTAISFMIVGILVVFVVIVFGTVMGLNARDRARSAQRQADRESFENAWASRLHDLARRMMTLDSAEQQAAGKVLLDHAHLLVPGRRQCGCPAPEKDEQWRVGGVEVLDK